MNFLYNFLKKAERFVWDKKWEEKAWPIRKFFYILQVLHLSIYGIKEDNIKFYSAALTYYSLLSIVPVFALIFAVAKGFNLEKILERILLTQLKGQELLVEKLLELARSLLERTKGSVIAGVGVLFLIWSVIKVFSEIDNAINDIWRSDKRRSLGRKFTDYFSLIIVAPIFYIISNSISLFISHKFVKFAGLIDLPHEIVSLILLSFKLIPIILLFILFSFMYVYIPTSPVKLKCAFLAGFIISIFYVLFQTVAVGLFLNISRYSAVYGSLAVLPILIIWIYFSWVLILFGAKIAYVSQNFDKVLYDFKKIKLNLKTKKHISLYIWGIISHHYITQKKAMSFNELYKTTNISPNTLQICLNLLIKANLLGKIENRSKEDAFIPLYDPHLLTVGEFLNIIEYEGNKEIIDDQNVKDLILLEEQKIKELNSLVIESVKV